MCATHYRAFRKSGNADFAIKTQLHGKTVAQRLLAWSEPTNEDGCRLWRGKLTPDGRGVISIKRTTYLAHRVAYELAHGPIREGFDVHHLCGNGPCIEVTHLVLLHHSAHLQMHASLKKRDRFGRFITIIHQ